MRTKNQSARALLVKEMQALAQTHGIHKVFMDFVEMFALCIANRMDKTQFETREKRYLDIVKAYSPADVDRLASMCALLIMAMQAEAETGRLRDVLGEIYHELELHDKWTAQFFTPQHIADMMGSMTLGKGPSIKPDTAYTVYEPAAGSGVMVLGFVNAMIQANMYNPHRVIVKAVDSDPKCVHMCYIQLSLYGVAAVVVHGNTITQEEWACWYTPVYAMLNLPTRGKDSEKP